MPITLDPKRPSFQDRLLRRHECVSKGVEMVPASGKRLGVQGLGLGCATLGRDRGEVFCLWRPLGKIM